MSVRCDLRFGHTGLLTMLSLDYIKGNTFVDLKKNPEYLLAMGNP